MNQSLTGEFTALFTALCWTTTAVVFEKATLRVGSEAVNIIKLVFGFLLLGFTLFLMSGSLVPLHLDVHSWLWLSLSGLLGFVLGDLFLFRAFAMIGARLSMLIMTLVPVLSAFSGWLLMNEKLTWYDAGGMTIALLGISIAILKGRKSGTINRGRLWVLGVVFAVLGAIGQATGLVFSKFGMGDGDAIPATQIRIIAGVMGYLILIIWTGKASQVIQSFKDKTAMLLIALGAVLGPFLGVTSSLYAVKFTTTGIASTIMALVPIFLILSALLSGRKVSWAEITGAILGTGGVALIFLT